MSTSDRPGVKFRRLLVPAGVVTPAKPPLDFDHVSVGNAGVGNIRIYSEDPTSYPDGDNYLVLAAGFERLIAAPSSHQFKRFESAFPAFWLQWEDPAATGTVVLIWA